MNRKIQLKALLILLCALWGLNSCRPAETPIPVTKDHPNPKNKSIIDHVGINVDEIFDNDESIISGDNPKNEIQYLGNKGYIGAIEIEKSLKDCQSKVELEIGTHYRVLAYKKLENTFTLDVNEDFVVGEDKKLDLDDKQSYTLILYSFGKKDIVPEPSNVSEIEKVSIDYTNEKLFLYDRQEDYSPVNEDRLNIHLKHQFTGMKIVLDASDYFGGNIEGHMTNITEAKITYKGFRKAIFNLGNGKPTLEPSGIDTTIENISFKDTENSKKGSIKESEWFYVVLPEDEQITFEARISMDKPMKNVNLGKINTKVNVKRGVRQTIKIKQQLCGALINNGAWKQFMCYNLGAYEGNSYPPANPLVGSDKSYLSGAKYHWGYPNNNAKMASQGVDLDNHNDNDKRLFNFDENKLNRKVEVWGENNRSVCPDGYRLPTKKELQTLAMFTFHGKELRFGHDMGDGRGDYNFRGGYLLDSSKGILYLPASGYRMWGKTNGIQYHGLDVMLWSSETANGSDKPGKYAYAIRIIGESNNSADSKKKDIDSYTKDGYYMSLRCVKK